MIRNFGVNNTILTPKYGPRVRFGSILSTAELPQDSMLETQLCNRCMQCVKMCPSNALNKEDYPNGLTDKKACFSYIAELNKRHISPCGIYIKVCPIGKDRVAYKRENAAIHTDKDLFANHHKAWNHVKSYGGKVCNYLNYSS